MERRKNRLSDPSLVTVAEVAWYLEEAIFLVSEDEAGVQGFVCANPQTGHVWALFVIDGAQGRGHGTALLDEAITRLRRAGHRQAFLTTGKATTVRSITRPALTASARQRSNSPISASASQQSFFKG